MALSLELGGVESPDVRRALEQLALQFPVGPKSPVFTIATLPAASVIGVGGLVFVSDGAAGSQARMSTGSAYIDLG